ncbi:MAG: flagellar basal body-associated FliL family protein [Clostridia bacterium]|nr:flagellar basal body-associated FliL family protein [Clostridia bacterium]
MPVEKGEQEIKKNKGVFDLRLIIVAVAIIVLAAGIAYVVAKMVINPRGALEDTSNQVISKTIGPIYELEEFTVNLAESNGRRFVKTSMILVTSSSSLRKELDEKRPLIRDRIIMILGEKRITDIENAAGKEVLKQEIISNINPLLSGGEIQEIYFVSFIFN